MRSKYEVQGRGVKEEADLEGALDIVSHHKLLKEDLKLTPLVVQIVCCYLWALWSL